MNKVLAAQSDVRRFNISGQDIRIGDKAVLSLSLLVHELATNAQKYGALSAQSGYVDLRWDVQGDDLVIRWIERGGPPVAEPIDTGLGSRLIRMGFLEQAKSSKPTIRKAIRQSFARRYLSPKKASISNGEKTFRRTDYSSHRGR